MRSMQTLSRRPVAMISTLMLLFMLAVIVTQRSQAKDEPKEKQLVAPEAATELPDSDSFIAAPQPRPDGLGLVREQLQPVPNPIGAVVFDEPVPGSPAWLSKLFCPLPARPEMLASETPDAAETEKLRTLRESLDEVLKEKASLLNAEALSAEIEVQRRQVTELKALKELQKLQQSLQELSDKFPDSEAGKRARDVLELLKSRTIRAVPNGALPFNPSSPESDDGFRESPVPARRSKLRLTPAPHQPARPQPVPNPTDADTP